MAYQTLCLAPSSSATRRQTPRMSEAGAWVTNPEHKLLPRLAIRKHATGPVRVERNRFWRSQLIRRVAPAQTHGRAAIEDHEQCNPTCASPGAAGIPVR